ncbi:MAG: GH1 family beta-glucosidase [Fimbriimonadales bacterium]|nr:GH1 family beta-glucosidase [Fimbriimonadales bacterium]
MAQFADGFAWGVATAAYQIEGAATGDGRGPCVWDMFCRKPGAVYHGHNGDIACDHYRLWREDVALMRELGVRAYRFSVSWPRVLPEGVGTVNEAGLEFYDRLVDALLEAGIQPWVTLFHWDFPLSLYHRGGWLNPDSASWFADYAEIVARRLGDRVRHWMTLNEPQCFISLGLQSGHHAPGDRLRFDEVLLASHHTLVASGKATQVLRAHSPGCRVGVVPAIGPGIPKDPQSAADREAAARRTFDAAPDSLWGMGWWIDPIVFGRYPDQALETFGEKAPKATDEQMRAISEPIDFIGLNVYTGWEVSADEEGRAAASPEPQGAPKTMMDWIVDDRCLYWGPRQFWERYGKPIAITENGLAGMDWVALDGKVHDPQRIDYTRRHLRQLAQAAQEGVQVLGYLHWSFLDNFEWAFGYNRRFGLVYVDYATQRRVPKDSFHWYAETIRCNGSNL